MSFWSVFGLFQNFTFQIAAPYLYSTKVSSTEKTLFFTQNSKILTLLQNGIQGVTRVNTRKSETCIIIILFQVGTSNAQYKVL